RVMAQVGEITARRLSHRSLTEPNAVAATPDGRLVAFYVSQTSIRPTDAKVTILRTSDETVIAEIPVARESVLQELKFINGGQRLFVWPLGHEATLFDVDNRNVKQTIPNHPLTWLAPSGTTLFAYEKGERKMLVYNLITGRHVQTIASPDDADLRRIAVSHSSEFAVVVYTNNASATIRSTDGHIEWIAPPAKRYRDLVGLTFNDQRVVFKSDTGREAVAAGDEGKAGFEVSMGGKPGEATVLREGTVAFVSPESRRRIVFANFETGQKRERLLFERAIQKCVGLP